MLLDFFSGFDPEKSILYCFFKDGGPYRALTQYFINIGYKFYTGCRYVLLTEMHWIGLKITFTVKQKISCSEMRAKYSKATDRLLKHWTSENNGSCHSLTAV